MAIDLIEYLFELLLSKQITFMDISEIIQLPADKFDEKLTGIIEERVQLSGRKQLILELSRLGFKDLGIKGLSNDKMEQVI